MCDSIICVWRKEQRCDQTITSKFKDEETAKLTTRQEGAAIKEAERWEPQVAASSSRKDTDDTVAFPFNSLGNNPIQSNPIPIQFFRSNSYQICGCKSWKLGTVTQEKSDKPWTASKVCRSSVPFSLEALFAVSATNSPTNRYSCIKQKIHHDDYDEDNDSTLLGGDRLSAWAICCIFLEPTQQQPQSFVATRLCEHSGQNHSTFGQWLYDPS